MKISKRFTLFLILAGLIVFQTSVFAHEKRAVDGKYNFVVGMVNEPAFSGSINALDLRISEGETPVEGLEKTLTAKVYFEDGEDSMDLILWPRHKQPGAYAGYFLPSKPGTYRFVIQGRVAGRAVDETFTAHPVSDPGLLRFPKS